MARERPEVAEPGRGEKIAERGGAGELGTGIVDVGADVEERAAEPFLLNRQPAAHRHGGDGGELRGKIFAGLRARLGPELEGNPGGVVAADFIEQRTGAGGSQLLEATGTLEAAPVITAVGGEQRVAAGELGLGDVAADELGRRIGKGGTGQEFRREQKARAAIHQEPRRLRQRDVVSCRNGGQALATGLVGIDQAMTGEQIVAEHTRRPCGQLGERGDLELNLDVGEVRQDMPEHLEGASIEELGRVAVAAHDDVELKVVVGSVGSRGARGMGRGPGAEDAAFAPAVAAAQDDGAEFFFRDDSAHAAHDAIAGDLEVALEGIVAVEGEARGAGRRDA